MGKVKTTPSGSSVVLNSSTDVVRLSTADAGAALANAASKSFAWPNGITPDDQLTVSAPSFTGNQTVTISSGANPSAQSRSMVLYFVHQVDTNYVATLNVTQLAGSCSISPQSLSFTEKGGTAQVTITSTYTDFSQTSVSIQGTGSSYFSTSQSGNKITITAQPNATTTQRQVTLKVTHARFASVTIPITQSATTPDYTYELVVTNTSAFNFSAGGNTDGVAIKANFITKNGEEVVDTKTNVTLTSCEIEDYPLVFAYSAGKITCASAGTEVGPQLSTTATISYEDSAGHSASTTLTVIRAANKLESMNVELWGQPYITLTYDGQGNFSWSADAWVLDASRIGGLSSVKLVPTTIGATFNPFGSGSFTSGSRLDVPVLFKSSGSNHITESSVNFAKLAIGSTSAMSAEVVIERSLDGTYITAQYIQVTIPNSEVNPASISITVDMPNNPKWKDAPQPTLFRYIG